MLSITDSRNTFLTLIASPSPLIRNLHLNRDNVLLSFSQTYHETVFAISDRLFNLIIIDMDWDAVTLLSLAKNAACINARTPTIILVDDTEQNQIRRFINAGFDDYLVKPLTLKRLEESIALWQEDDHLAIYVASIRTLLSKTKNNMRLVRILYDKLFEELPGQIKNIESAIESGDFKTAYEVTHNLNGSAKTCYLTHIAEIANALETNLIQNNTDYANGFLWILKQSVASFIQHRKSILTLLTSGQ